MTLFELALKNTPGAGLDRHAIDVHPRSQIMVQ
jgi:hypothetical protein